MLESLDLDFERFEAIKPTKNEVLKMDRITPRIKNYINHKIKIERGLGIVGCYLSHLKVLEKYRNSSHKYICILEDDVKFDSLSLKLVNDNIEFLNSKNLEWDIFRSVSGFSKVNTNLFLNNKIYKFDSPNNQSVSATSKKINSFSNGTHFQIINVKNIEKIISYLNRENIFNIDSVYSTNEINIYAVKNKDLNISLHEKYRLHTNIPKI